MTFGVTEDITVTCGVELPANARPGITQTYSSHWGESSKTTKCFRLVEYRRKTKWALGEWELGLFLEQKPKPLGEHAEHVNRPKRVKSSGRK